MTDTKAPGWDTLAYAVRQRRKRLGMTQKDVADRGGPGIATMNKIEAARDTPFRPRTLTSLDTALGWEPGTAHGIVTGDIPGAWLNDFTKDVENVIIHTGSLNTEAFSQAEIQHFADRRWSATPQDSTSGALGMISTEETLARLRRARDDLNAAIEAIQTASAIAELDRRQREADNTPLKDIMGLAALQEDAPNDDDPDQGSQDPSDY